MAEANFHNLRFSHDQTSKANSASEYNEHKRFVLQTRRYLLSHAVTISDEIFPDTFCVFQEVGKKIAPELSIEPFVIPNPIPQAYCINLSSANNLALVFTSAIIELLSKEEMQFVIGHELGHHIFEHYKHPKPENAVNELTFLRQLFFSRCAEISADRMGFIASSSVDDALRGMLKIASGLSEKHIRLNIPVFLDQIKQIKDLRGYNEGKYLSHPIIPLRMRALLWFSMSDSYYQATGRSVEASLAKESMDQYITKDLDAISDSTYFDQERKATGNIVLWASLKIATLNGTLDKKDQDFMKEFVAPELIDKAISFLKSSKKNQTTIINDRLKIALHSGRGIRIDEITKIKDSLAKISRHLLNSPDEASELIQQIDLLACDS